MKKIIKKFMLVIKKDCDNCRTLEKRIAYLEYKQKVARKIYICTPIVNQLDRQDVIYPVVFSEHADLPKGGYTEFKEVKK